MLYLFAQSIARGGHVLPPDRIVIRALSEVMLAQSRGERSVEKAQAALSDTLTAMGWPVLPKASGE